MLKDHVNKLIQIERKRLLIYIVVYFGWGYAMNIVGTEFEIAKFTYWWQIISCYILYMVPVSIMLRGYSFFTQYAYGVVAMGVLEFGGYAFETSYAFPNNLLDQFFGIRNFALAMTLFFGVYFPVGNALVDKIYGWLNGSKHS